MISLLPDTGSLGAMLSAHPVGALAAVYAGGVLTSLTPCLYPMIPVTVSIVGGSAGAGKRSRRMSLALTYVVGLAAAYAALGLLAGLTGTLFGAVSTNPWLLFAMANVMLFAAMMMADVIPVPIPAGLRDRAATMGEGGRYTGVLVMGVVSGLVAAPCGAPVMAAVLTWVSATGSAWLGFLYLFVFSLGMSSLLLAFALVADTSLRLPRAGPWMLWVKRAFAIILLGVAEYYLITMGQVLI
ncbi:MAG TPA: cytochrome c biogenesis protein CcdA [Gemmatimonadaceae bacterium]|nr:cytochrome c biogenesis protein CcdA [Gemmatimonadaceae bacterium]